MTDRPWTAGPWQWFGNTKHSEPYLATVAGGRVFVLDTRAEVESCECCDDYDADTETVTAGCNHAESHRARGHLRFQTDERMTDAHHHARYEVLNGETADENDERLYRHDFVGIDHPDAELIALAPEMAEAIIKGCETATMGGDVEYRLLSDVFDKLEAIGGT